MKVYLIKVKNDDRGRRQLKDAIYFNENHAAVQTGDYAFVKCDGRIVCLWKAVGDEPYIDPQTAVSSACIRFARVADLNWPLRDFVRARIWQPDVQLLNATHKSTVESIIELRTRGASAADVERLSQQPNALRADDVRKWIVCTLSYAHAAVVRPDYRDGDLFFTVSDDAPYDCEGIFEKEGDTLRPQADLQRLFEQKCLAQPAALGKILTIAKGNGRSGKVRFLNGLLGRIEEDGYFECADFVRLYDSLFVCYGRAPEGEEAAEDGDTEDAEQERYVQIARQLQKKGNLILCGPPGTGKTYALRRVVDVMEQATGGSYKRACDEGRVKTVTFHPSFGYEEFVEGIRPVFEAPESDREEAGRALRYRIESGVFKAFVRQAKERAATQPLNRAAGQTVFDADNISDVRVWKISLGSVDQTDVYSYCLQHDLIAINWDASLDFTGMSKEEIVQATQSLHKDACTLDYFVNGIQKNDLVLVLNSAKTIRAIGLVTSDYYREGERFAHRRKVKWLKVFESPFNVFEKNGGVNLTLQTVYPLTRIQAADVVQWIGEESVEPAPADTPSVPDYYFCIDEINRGDVAKIFGELIALIEKDKRSKMAVTLPYSKESFDVPPNLYVLATMNTVDRSVVQMDAALRRRFRFYETEPRPELLDELRVGSDGLRLDRLLQALNAAIEKDIGRDYRIGHAYLMPVQTVEDVCDVWRYEVLPLLREYYHQIPRQLERLLADDALTDAAASAEQVGRALIRLAEQDDHTV